MALVTLLQTARCGFWPSPLPFSPPLNRELCAGARPAARGLKAAGSRRAHGGRAARAVTGLALAVTEVFYSLQGEGITAGTPAVFIRLRGCNLRCRYCDTKHAWERGEEVPIERLLGGVLEHRKALERGAHLVVTGGEPLLQQEGLAELLRALKSHVPGLCVEVETNATLMPRAELDEVVDQYNVSPKLSNSDVPESLRIREGVLEFFARSSKAYFKFAVADERDVLEILTHPALRRTVTASRERVMLMPLAATREEYARAAPAVAALCLKYGFRFSPRLQIELGLK